MTANCSVSFHFTANLPELGLSPNHKMSETDIQNYKLPSSIGVKWKDLARALGFFEQHIDVIEEEKCHCVKDCCIKVLVLWMNREGDNATAARLADALRTIGLKNLADILIYPIDPSQVSMLLNQLGRCVIRLQLQQCFRVCFLLLFTGITTCEPKQ